MTGISIIVACFNRENTIRQCIDSIIEQNINRNYEILICDDGSTDNSLAIAKSYNLENIKIITKPTNETKHGASIARNRGLAIAQYDYICFLDSDDWYLPNYLNTASKYLDEHPNLGYIFCRCKKSINTNDGKQIIKDWTRKKLTYIDKKYHVLFRAFNINTNVIMIKKHIINQVGFFDSSLAVGEDSDMWIRINDVCAGDFIDFYAAVYRINHNKNQLTKTDSNITLNCAIRINLKNIERQLCKKNKDKMSLYLSVRTLLFLQYSKIKYSILRRMLVFSYSLIIFPIQYIKFLYYVLLKR